MSHGIRHLDLFVTEACNLACPYCFARGRIDAAHMSMERAREAIAWLCESRSDRLHITLWGGEPLLRLPWLVEVAEEFQSRARAAGKSASLSLPTNATLLNEEAFDWVERFGVKTFLSIDGAEKTQAQRPLASGKSSHELVSQGLRAALLRNQPVTVRMTVTPDNVGNLPENVAYFANLGVHRLMVYPAYDLPWSNEAIEAFGRAEQQVGDMLATWIVQTPLGQHPIRLDGWSFMLRRLANVGVGRSPLDPISPCGVGNSLVALNVDGRFTPCHRFTFYGRAKGELWDFGDDVFGMKTSDAFHELTWQKQKGDGLCSQCEEFPFCSMGCVAINFATTGDLLTVPLWACALQRQRIRACRALHDRLDGHPSYAAYLGQSASTILNTHAKNLGKRAARLWVGLLQRGNEPWQNLT